MSWSAGDCESQSQGQDNSKPETEELYFSESMHIETITPKRHRLGFGDINSWKPEQNLAQLGSHVKRNK